MNPNKTTLRVVSNVNELEEFKAIYARYHKMVRAVAFNISGPQELDDLVQETFIRIWKSMSTFEGAASLKTWVYRITVNATLDQLRKKKRWRLGWNTDVNLQVAETQASPSLEVSRAGQELVQKSLARLKDEQRTVLVLHSLEGLSIEEIAEVLDLPEGTVRSRLFYAKKNVADFLKSEGVSL